MKPFVASHLKDMNRRTVYKLLSSVGEISRAEISRRTGISAPTVLKIIDFFIESGFVTEEGEGDSPIGRKPQVLRFNPEAGFSIGVQFEGGFIKIGIVDLQGNIKLLKQIEDEDNFNEVLSKHLRDGINSLIAESGIALNKFLGVGIAIPGAVNPQQRVIEYAPILGITETTDYSKVMAVLSKELGMPVIIENDVNAAAIGEFVTRKLSEDSDLLYITLGVAGLGAGLILDGRLRRGRRYSAGEIGYMVFDKNFRTYKSETGWLESQIIRHPLYKRLWKSMYNAQKSCIENQIIGGGFDDFIDSIASNIALGISNLCMTLDSELVVLGGISAEILGNKLLDRVREYLDRLCILDIDCQFKKCSEPEIVGTASIITDTKLAKLLEA